ncbi:helix-turn-helix transcriptional regulator [Spirosoma sp. BT702]|uniref:Helix-turn-helix transcriptional regulator n=1 Tax=Spirosoma profusum TaxID=2771354 RepID=A0A927AT21_9BACT|nr:helix-turn-helix transcriptional regulator [Spirosoma profusum]MBD2699072.1 helix-turn-helix transcriptional regulator [Spirosoma profusum]
MVQQVTIFLLLFGALQGGLLSIWFLKNRRNEPANLYISLFLLVAGLQLTLKVIAKVWLYQNVLWLYMLSYQLPYLIGPLLFLYVKAKTTNKRALADWWHFVLFGLATLWMTGVYVTEGEIREVHPFAKAAFQTLSLGIYTWLAYRIAPQSLKPFLRVAAITEQIIIVTLALMVVYYGRFPDVRLLFVALTLLIYWVSYQVIAKAGPFTQISDQTPTQPQSSISSPKSPKYARSSLKPDEADRIEQALQRSMAVDKLFLDSSQTIDTLAEKLATSRHHLSQVLNERMQQSYADYMNTLRLEEAQQRLRNPAYFHYTIAAIAFDSGFNSLASFNEAFRRQYGTTPSKFREPFLKKLST